MAGNPYAMTGRATYDGPTQLNHDDMGPNADYAMSEEQAPYAWEGYADKPDGEFRTGQIKEEGYNLTGYPDVDPAGTDWKQRHIEEGTDPLDKGRVVGYSKEFDLSAYRNPPEGYRLTQLLNPNNYGYHKPLDEATRGEMHLSGHRYSLADFPSDKDRVGGQIPFRPLRNTFRVESRPWDAALVDTPDPMQSPDSAAGIGGFGGGSYRLGG